MFTFSKKSMTASAVFSIVWYLLLKSAFYGSTTTIYTVLKLAVLLVFPLLSMILPWYRKKTETLYDCLTKPCHTLKRNSKSITTVAVCFGFSIILAEVLSMSVSAFVTHRENNFIIYNFFLAVSLLGCVLVTNRKHFFEKLHTVVFCIIMITGGCCINVSSTEAIMGYDEITHYRNVVIITDAISGQSNVADEKIVNAFDHHNIDLFSEEGRKQNDEEYNNLFYEPSKAEQTTQYLENTRAYCYLPYIAGTVIGRGLHLPFTVTHDISMYANLLFYASIVSEAIKRVRSNKVIMTCMATVGVILFEAASYQYDPFMIGTILLAHALFLQACEEKKMTYQRLAGIMILMLLGIYVKPVYFPIMLPMLFVPKEIFEDEKQRKVFNTFTVITMALLCFAIFAPVFTGSIGKGDVRGGSDVNALEQVKFILADPFNYAVILLKHAFTELFPFIYASTYLFAYGSIGYATVSILPFFLFIGGVLFSDENTYVTKKYRLASWLGWSAAIVLTITSMYVAFTAVGSQQVAGVQQRYMLPTLFTLFAAVPHGWKNVKKYGGLYGAGFATFMAFMLISTVCHYYYVMF